FLEILEKFGRPTVDAAVRRMVEDGEARTRAALAELPQGSWTAVDWLDDDGVTEDPVRMEVTVTVADGTFTVDFAGSSPATPGPINMPFGATIAICKVVLKALTSPDEPSNFGTTVPLEVRAEPGTLFHAVYPQPTFTLWTGIVAVELIL
ncbi:hydantoinase B/oxoprolinase family protein, partial [Streptosporangium sp. V21-05]|uniref:hydantoinase B/oxoprolinase family protein n=1 Tax=Streptosporangium sp. V21-05 TaxID=3446115 RepID=UPI003F53CEB7